MRIQKTSRREVAGMNLGLAISGQAIPDLYLLIFKNLPVGVILLCLENSSVSPSLRFVDVNFAAAQMMGLDSESLLGKDLADFAGIGQKDILDQLLRSMRLMKADDLGELSFGEGLVRQQVCSARAIPLSRQHICVLIQNVTDRKVAEDRLQESEEHLHLLIQGVKEYAIFQIDPQGHVVSWNAGAQRLKGYKADEIIGKHFSTFYPSELIERGEPQHVLAAAVRNGQFIGEGWRVRKDGTRFWAMVVLTSLRDEKGKIRGFIKLTRDATEIRQRLEALKEAKTELEMQVDQRAAALTRVNQELRMEISERKRVENQLRATLDQLRALAAQTQSVREEERTRVAREIHDELGQACTAIKMDLVLLKRRLNKRQTQLQDKINSTVELVDNMIASLRRIASDLMPRTLQDLGLPAALEWQAQEFQSHTGIPCALSLPQDAIPLDSEQSIAIFRIFQESLTNVARHAHASRVEVQLEKDGEELFLKVHDNGSGFNATEAKKRKSLGLVGMQERALLLNGSLDVQAIPGAGTTVTLSAPIKHLGPC